MQADIRCTTTACLFFFPLLGEDCNKEGTSLLSVSRKSFLASVSSCPCYDMTKVLDLAVPQRLLFIHIILEEEKEVEEEKVATEWDVVISAVCCLLWLTHV